ncbi:MAG: SRPBCC domain-containing protein [Gemmatimonadetes bacterium]|jgi:uncharacterized protein YndB with AHSA1/START domain|nr:SRPBCC domain-containing protein [Gemmatimonadota bacterium]MBT6144398.1 SRPBCC domain-containing protein [Gemmatimonadota bacterium]MBT7863365.1 SRPBCC domain-containing protein [Gemmatimonadota bacterium]
MAEIKHRIQIHSSPSELYRALTDRDGLSRWWTPMVETDSREGSIAQFRFGDGEHGPDMEIRELAEDRCVAWQCVDGPWKGHDFRFQIRPEEGDVVLLFEHSGWEDTSEFYMHCNAKWGFFLGVSLKGYLETGKGQPHPDEPDL